MTLFTIKVRPCITFEQRIFNFLNYKDHFKPSKNYVCEKMIVEFVGEYEIFYSSKKAFLQRFPTDTKNVKLFHRFLTFNATHHSSSTTRIELWE